MNAASVAQAGGGAGSTRTPCRRTRKRRRRASRRLRIASPRALSHEQAIHELLEGAKTQFDPEIVEVLVGHGLRQASAYLVSD
jgi:hypothetical protein